MGYGNPYSDVPGTGLHNSPSEYESTGMSKNFKDARQGTDTRTNRPKQQSLGRKKKLNGLKRVRG